MLRIIVSTSSAAAKKYFRDGLTREGYYNEGIEEPGIWTGQAAQNLGLHGRVQGMAFGQLCDNINPVTGKKLTPRNKDFRRVGYDFNFHAPKPVTLLHAWKRDERILQIFQQSVRETMADIEHEMATRVRSGGRNESRQTGNMVWGEFVHYTARPVNGIPDPHLHAHCYVFNTTFDSVENRWKAGEFGDIKRFANYYQAAFLSRLANGLKALGYEIELDGKSFGIVGITRAMSDKFSRRTKVVKAKAEELGLVSDEDKDGLAALTREKKVKDMPLSRLEPIWWERLTPEEKEALNHLASLPSRAAAATPGTATADGFRSGTRAAQVAVDMAMNHIFERVSVTTERDLIAEALQWGYGRASLAEIQQVVRDTAMIRVQQKGRTLVTTWAVRAEEGRIVDRCKQGKSKFPALNPTWRIEDQMLNLQQKGAVFHILGSRDFITGIEGKSGVGKSRLLHEVCKAIERNGHKLVLLTPGAEAANETMPNDGFKNVRTVAKLLQSESLQREARGSVWLVDEAGLISCRTMDKLTRLAEQLEARLVLVGDTKQHHSVERGQAFELLQKFGELRVVTVDEIQRQTGAYKRAVEQIAARDFPSAFKTLENMKAFREMPVQEREKALATDYLQLAKEGKSVLIVSPTHAECENVTHAIRETLKQQDELSEGKKWNILQNLSWTEAQRSSARHYAPGLIVKVNKPMKGFKMGEPMLVVSSDNESVLVLDRGRPKELPLYRAKHFNVFERDWVEVSKGDRIRITANGRDMNRHRLNNGNLYTVKKLERDGSILMENGIRLAKDFEHLDYGYTTTSHAAQGKTVDCVLVAQSGLMSAGASDAKQFYVSVSRGRKEVRIYTDDVEALRENVAREREREMAMEITDAEPEREDDMEMEID